MLTPRQEFDAIFEEHCNCALYIYNTAASTYLGRLVHTHQDLIWHNRTEVKNVLLKMHKKVVANYVVFASDKNHRPDTLNPIFSGDEWVEVWDVMD